MKPSLLLPTLALVCGVLSARPVHAQSTPSDQVVLKSTHASFKEYFELLSMPNDAIVPADIVKNAVWLDAAFARRGFLTRQLPNARKPLLYAEYPKPGAGAQTGLFYMHFAGQPVRPDHCGPQN